MRPSYFRNEDACAGKMVSIVNEAPPETPGSHFHVEIRVVQHDFKPVL